MLHRELQDINPYVRISVCTKTHSDWAIKNRIIYDHQLVLTSKGRGQVIINGKNYQAAKGDFFIIKPGVVHSFIASNDDPFEMLVTHFDYFYDKDHNFWPHKKVELEHESESVELPESHLVREIPVFGENTVFPDYFRPNDYVKLEVLMNKLIELNQEAFKGKELLVKSVFLEVLFLIYKEIQNKEKKVSSPTGFERIKMAFDYVNENYSQMIAVSDLADRCHLSTNYFSQIFKENTGYSPKEYLIKVRMDNAKRMLIQTDANVMDICRGVGFTDIHHFSKIFKKMEGMSPSVYRRNEVIGLDP